MPQDGRVNAVGWSRRPKTVAFVVRDACYVLSRSQLRAHREVRPRCSHFGRVRGLELLASLAAEAEAASWDGFFIWDVLLGAGDAEVNEALVDPWVTLTAIALSTSRIRFGAFMTPLARRRPWDVARSVAMLDRLSAGRITFGAGLGFRPEEFRAIGEEPDPSLRAEKLDEGLAIIDALWQGGPVTFSGHHYKIGPVSILPTPLQVPRVPIWTACGWPHRRPRDVPALRRALTR